MSQAPAIEARALTKSYGRHRGIVDISLTVNRGEVFGLVGANGAGKSTFMRTLLDFIRPTSGSIDVFGESVVANSVAVRRRCTYLPGEFVVPARLTGNETIRRYSFTRKNLSQPRIEDLAKRLGLDLNRRVGDLSKGNKQKIGLILAFAPEVDLVVLDEPTSGLDPILQRIFAELVSETAGRGSAVLLSSHVMSEVEEIADRVALLRDGRLAAKDDISTLLTESRRRGTSHLAQPSDAPTLTTKLTTLTAVNERTTVSDVHNDGGVVTFACQGSVDPILKLLAGFNVVALDLSHADLEDAFFGEEEDLRTGQTRGAEK